MLQAIEWGLLCYFTIFWRFIRFILTLNILDTLCYWQILCISFLKFPIFLHKKLGYAKDRLKERLVARKQKVTQYKLFVLRDSDSKLKQVFVLVRNLKNLQIWILIFLIVTLTVCWMLHQKHEESRSFCLVDLRCT